MKKNTAFLGSLIAGFIVACIIISMQCFDSKRSHAEKAVKTTQFAAHHQFPSPDLPKEEVKISVSSSSLPSSTHVEVSRHTLCLFEILFEEEIEFQDYKTSIHVPLTKFFQTLFKAIISPNAP